MADQLKGTALITGASSGIGAAFARQLAAQGNDLILVSRRQDWLQMLADDLSRQYPGRVEVLPADLSKADELAQVEKRLADCQNLTLLVNNAGFGVVGSFLQVPIERHVEMINVHILATTRLCYAA